MADLLEKETPQAMQNIEATGPRAEVVKGLRDAFSAFFNQRPEMEIENGVATIHAYGPMMDDASPIDLAQGATSYEEIRADLAMANAMDEVESIILVARTPGGTVSGIEETYQDIVNSEKPVYGYNAGMATSAGYYLLAGTESITVSPSSTTGNIGTVLDMWDFSEVYKKMGAKREVLTNEGADLKGTMRGPLQESQREFLQDQINAMGEQFQNRVVENRPEIDDEVFRAGWYQPEEAGALGLIDAVGSLRELKQSLK